MVPPQFRRNQKIYDFTDGCFVYDKASKNITQYDSLTPCPSSPEKTIQRRNEQGQQDYQEDPNYYPVMFGAGHLLPVIGAQGKSLSVQDLETSLRDKTGQSDQELSIEVYATRFNKKKLLIHSIKVIPEFEAISLKRNNNGAYELQFNYDEERLEQNNVVGLYVETPEGDQTISLSTLTPSPSLAFQICSGVLAVLGGAALIVGALASAAVITAFAPPIGVTMVVVGAIALASGIGLFSKATAANLKDSLLEDSLKVDHSLVLQ